MSVFIYSLSDPRTGRIRYVGKSKNAARRLSQHVSNFEKGYKANWIRGLKSLGLRPEMDILEKVEESEWEESERFWISYLKFIGCQLMNIDLGGGGAHKVSDDTRKKCSLIHLGKKRSMESRLKMRMAQLGKKQSPETIEKRRLKSIGKKRPKRSLEFIVKQREAQGGPNYNERSSLAARMLSELPWDEWGILAKRSKFIGVSPSSVLSWIGKIRAPNEKYIEKIKQLLGDK